MTPRPNAQLPLDGLALLKCASWFVPAAQREEWSAEWRAELWHVHRSRHAVAHAHPTVTAFCLGAFHDAIWLRENRLHADPRVSTRFESARQCGALLAVLAVVSLTVSLSLPGVRRSMLATSVAGPQNLVSISREGSPGSPVPTISVEEFYAWKHRRQSLFADLAFYRPARAEILTGIPGTKALSVAIASVNLFELLKTPLPSAALELAKTEHKPALVLSHAAWTKYFGQDTHLIGRQFDVAGQQAVVAAILPDGSPHLPSQPDAWLLADNSYLTALPVDSNVFVIGQIAASAQGPRTSGSWYFTVPRDTSPDEHEDAFDCTPVNSQAQLPFITFLFTLMLACLALPATTPLPLGDYPATDRLVFREMRWRRWIFLLTKIGLATVTVYCISASLAFADPAMNPDSSEYIQFATAFLGLLFSFRWALRDQRRRCPVCLRVLTNPARVGHPSRNFLAWHGTEFICGKGHGLLHIPEMATSWFSTQRWLYLDPSWMGLFPEAYSPSA